MTLKEEYEEAVEQLVTMAATVFILREKLDNDTYEDDYDDPLRSAVYGIVDDMGWHSSSLEC